jgi:hypothetical protein
MATITIKGKNGVEYAFNLPEGVRQEIMLEAGESIDHPTRLGARIGGPAILAVTCHADGGVDVTELD